MPRAEPETGDPAVFAGKIHGNQGWLIF